MEKDLRKLAIERYLKGESQKTVYTDICRSKNWFFKWLRRYQSGDPNWSAGHSRVPANRPKSISSADRKRIVEIRCQLEFQRYAQTGPSAIKWGTDRQLHGAKPVALEDRKYEKAFGSERGPLYRFQYRSGTAGFSYYIKPMGNCKACCRNRR